MKIKLYVTFLCLVTALFKVRAQDNKASKWSMDFGGSIGAFIPFDQVKGSKKLTGFNAMTCFQLNYKQNYFIKLQFGQTTVNYKSNISLNGFNSFIDSKANCTNLGLGVGYQGCFGRFQPFILAGGGASFVDIPGATFDSQSQMINYITSCSAYAYIDAGVGLNYKISRSFVIFLEGQGTTIPELPKKSSTHLTGISTLIGIKAPL